MQGGINCATGDNSVRITYWQNGEQIKSAGIRNAGTYTVRMSPWNDLDTCVEKEVTIQKRELTVTGVNVLNRGYDGTNEVLIDGVVFENAVEGEVVFGFADGTVIVSGTYLVIVAVCVVTLLPYLSVMTQYTCLPSRESFIVTL